MRACMDAVVVAFCSTCGLLSCAPAENELAFRFNWPVPSHATVQMEVQEDGVVSRISYSLDLSRGNAPNELLLHMGDFAFLQLGDADLNDPAVRAELAPLLAMTAAVPPLVVSSSGQFLRVDNWDNMVDQVSAVLRKIDPSMNDALLEHVTGLMKHPDTRQSMQANAVKEWGLWVTAWNGQRLRRGTPREFDYSMALPLGGQAQAHATLTYLPPGPENPKLHQVRVRTECTGSDFREAMLKAIESLLPTGERTDGKRAEIRAAIGQCSLITETVAVTDPATLMPSTVVSTRTTRIESNQGDGQVKIEIRKYTFDWH